MSEYNVGYHEGDEDLQKRVFILLAALTAFLFFNPMCANLKVSDAEGVSRECHRPASQKDSSTSQLLIRLSLLFQRDNSATHQNHTNYFQR